MRTILHLVAPESNYDKLNGLEASPRPRGRPGGPPGSADLFLEVELLDVFLGEDERLSEKHVITLDFQISEGVRQPAM